MEKPNFKSLTYAQMAQTLQDWGVAGYRLDQVYRWIFREDVASFHEMTNLSKALREKLAGHFSLSRLQPVSVQTSQDGTRKFLFELADGQRVESVLIPNGDRQTLCISSQVGCAMACRFCLTGTMGLKRQMSHDEIVEQVLAVRRYSREGRPLTNIVFMGMGEPMHNLQNVLEALKFLLDERGMNFSKNKITVSTCGLVPQMLEFGKHSPVKLAISLTGTNDVVRDELIPINRRYDLKQLMEACREYPLPKGGRITFEYTLLSGVNDSLNDARELTQLLEGVKAKVNLIPFNEYPGAQYRRSSDATMLAFQKYLLDRGIQTNIRHSRGTDILGACGQLKANLPGKPREVPGPPPG